MRVSWERWERMDVLGPVYKMVAQGLNDGEIAKKLGLPEPTVQDCVSWLCHFLETSTRATLRFCVRTTQHNRHFAPPSAGEETDRSACRSAECMFLMSFGSAMRNH